MKKTGRMRDATVDERCGKEKRIIRMEEVNEKCRKRKRRKASQNFEEIILNRINNKSLRILKMILIARKAGKMRDEIVDGICRKMKMTIRMGREKVNERKKKEERIKIFRFGRY